MGSLFKSPPPQVVLPTPPTAPLPMPDPGSAQAAEAARQKAASEVRGGRESTIMSQSGNGGSSKQSPGSDTFGGAKLGAS